jgi:hypothetical protein
VQVAYASPPPVPAGYSSPYYSPVGVGPQAPVHRTPWILIVSAVVVLIVLMAGCGTAIALLGGGKFTFSGGISGLPSPTPGVSPSPIAQPTLAPGATSVSNDGVTVPLLSGWSLANKDAQSIGLLNPAGNGSLVVASGTLNPRQTAQQGKDAVDKVFAGKYPDARPCPGSTTKTGSLNGVSGIFWTLCYTVVQSGRSFPAASSLFAGANANGSVGCLLELATLQNNLQAFITESAPIVQGIQWKLK